MRSGGGVWRSKFGVRAWRLGDTTLGAKRWQEFSLVPFWRQNLAGGPSLRHENLNLRSNSASPWSVASFARPRSCMSSRSPSRIQWSGRSGSCPLPKPTAFLINKSKNTPVASRTPSRRAGTRALPVRGSSTDREDAIPPRAWSDLS